MDELRKEIKQQLERFEKAINENCDKKEIEKEGEKLDSWLNELEKTFRKNLTHKIKIIPLYLQ